jgi:hypothetical protein
MRRERTDSPGGSCADRTSRIAGRSRRVDVASFTIAMKAVNDGLRSPEVT